MWKIPTYIFLSSFVIWTTFMVCRAVRADDQWVNSPNKAWFDAAEATPEAQKRFNIIKCCASAEVVKTKFQQRGESWWFLDNSSSTWRQVPDYIIWYDKHPPDNQPTLFIWNGNLTCFFVPDPET